MSINPAFPKQVKIVEVGPRDGLQNFPAPLSLQQRIRLTNLLSECGFQEIECAAHVSPLWVPQMVAARSLLLAIYRNPKTLYTSLVPNERGMREAIQGRASKIAVFTAASESFNKRNINASILESIERFGPVIQMAHASSIPCRAYVSTAFDCPDEGKIAPQQVWEVVRRLVDLGCQDISIGDTTGKATPDQVRALLDVLVADFSRDLFGMHFHDTYGNALKNVRASLDYGISVYDSSAGGVGGCPYAQGAKGNVATGDLIRLFDSLGIYSGVDLQKLMLAEQYLVQATQEAQERSHPSDFVAALKDLKLQRKIVTLQQLIQAKMDLSELLKSSVDGRQDVHQQEMLAADHGELLNLIKTEFNRLLQTNKSDVESWLASLGAASDAAQRPTAEFLIPFLSKSPL